MWQLPEITSRMQRATRIWVFAADIFLRCLDVKADNKTMDTVAEQVLDEIDYIERLGAHVLVYVAVGAIRPCFTEVEQE